PVGRGGGVRRRLRGHAAEPDAGAADDRAGAGGAGRGAADAGAQGGGGAAGAAAGAAGRRAGGPMTRVLVSEFLCGGGREGPARASGWASALSGEGWAMLAAAAADLRAVPGVEAVTLLDEGFRGEPAVRDWPVRWVAPGGGDA